MALFLVKFLGSMAVPTAAAGFGERYCINTLSKAENYIPVISELSAPIGASVPGAGGLTLNMFTVPNAIGLVGLINVVGTGALLTYFAITVGFSRKHYGVEFPDLYAKGDDEKSKEFNCMQRGHQNCLESYPSFLALSMVGGLRHPFLTAAAGALWIIARISFFNGYREGADARYSKFLANKHWWAMGILTALAGSTSLGLLNIV